MKTMKNNTVGTKNTVLIDVVKYKLPSVSKRICNKISYLLNGNLFYRILTAIIWCTT
jgi:hypothetical protein